MYNHSMGGMGVRMCMTGWYGSEGVYDWVVWE